MSNIIGICGVARVGKDTLFEAISQCCPNKRIHRRAFADGLKEECEQFLSSNVGISAFTEDEGEKLLIRPFLVTYGTHLRRKMDPYCWIKIVSKSIERSTGEIFIITDLRYENELDWVKDGGGTVIHLSRHGILPANKEEEENDPILRRKATMKITLPTFGPDYLLQCKQRIKSKIPSIPTLN